jgi:uncharacterized membrane protein YtjA (UPF0391 family)
MLQAYPFPLAIRTVIENRMLPLALAFFVAASLAAAIGYTTVIGVILESARVLFFIFLVCTLMALIGAASRGRHSHRTH